jgi:Fic family protein
MVYIYKKTIGKKEYYYLRASEKKGNKLVTKDLAYLGSNIEDIKKSLENLPKYKQEIRKAYKTIHNFLESNRFIDDVKKLKLKQDLFLGEKLAFVEACKLHYLKEFQKHDSLTKQEILKNFLIEFAYNTTSIEGNTIKLQEAKKLLEEGKTPKNRTLREIYDLQNTEKVFFEIIEKKEEITHNFIIDIHKNLLDNIDKRIGYRNQDVRVIKANFKSTPAPYLKTDMNLLLKWYSENKEKLHPFVLAIIFQHKFEKIHPFMDGNGRTGRMLLNYILIKNNFPPIVIRNKNREKYLKAMRKADNSDLFKAKIEDYYDLIQFVADEMVESYWNIFL